MSARLEPESETPPSYRARIASTGLAPAKAITIIETPIAMTIGPRATASPTRTRLPVMTPPRRPAAAERLRIRLFDLEDRRETTAHHYCRPVCQRQNLVEIGRYEQRGSTTSLVSDKLLKDEFHRTDIETSRRLRGDKQLRSAM